MLHMILVSLREKSRASVGSGLAGPHFPLGLPLLHMILVSLREKSRASVGSGLAGVVLCRLLLDWPL